MRTITRKLEQSYREAVGNRTHSLLLRSRDLLKAVDDFVSRVHRFFARMFLRPASATRRRPASCATPETYSLCLWRRNSYARPARRVFLPSFPRALAASCLRSLVLRFLRIFCVAFLFRFRQAGGADIVQSTSVRTPVPRRSVNTASAFAGSVTTSNRPPLVSRFARYWSKPLPSAACTPLHLWQRRVTLRRTRIRHTARAGRLAQSHICFETRSSSDLDGDYL